MPEERPAVGAVLRSAAEGAPKAASASFLRFTLRSGLRMPPPKWRTTSLYTGCPGSISSWAMRSAWTRRAPSATNISPTTDFPEAMPPVRPTLSIVSVASVRWQVVSNCGLNIARVLSGNYQEIQSLAKTEDCGPSDHWPLAADH